MNNKELTEEKKIEEIAKLFHDTYERLAPQYGYKTRVDTRIFDADSPNGQLMLAVVSEVLSKQTMLCGDLEKEIVYKLLATINNCLAENGIKDTDGTPVTFSPEVMLEETNE